MDIKTTLPITEARKKIFQILNEIQKPGVRYTLTENGRPKAVLMSAMEFESWVETMEIMNKFPQLKKDIALAKTDYEQGDYLALEEILAREGYILADKAKTQYEASISRAPKNKKRVR